jgi:hypothetical protein
MEAKHNTNITVSLSKPTCNAIIKSIIALKKLMRITSRPYLTTGICESSMVICLVKNSMDLFINTLYKYILTTPVYFTILDKKSIQFDASGSLNDANGS